MRKKMEFSYDFNILKTFDFDTTSRLTAAVCSFVGKLFIAIMKKFGILLRQP